MRYVSNVIVFDTPCHVLESMFTHIYFGQISALAAAAAAAAGTRLSCRSFDLFLFIRDCLYGFYLIRCNKL